MITCSIVGCTCQGSKDGHRPMKAHECGFVFYAASFGPRYGDTLETHVSLTPGKAGKAAQRALAFYEQECRSLCEECEDGCECNFDLAYWGEHPVPSRFLFTPAELREHRLDLLAGKVICLPH